MHLGAEHLASACARYVKPVSFYPSYGTAGFRDKAELLDSTLYRCGILAGLRALQTGQAVGLMVTASHNPEDDNGVKLVDPTGEMLEPLWEGFATELVQAADAQALADRIAQIVASQNIRMDGAERVLVVIGCDTRSSSSRLAAAACDGVLATSVAADNIGQCTTPMLHHFVRSRNLGVDHSEAAYFHALAAGFHALTSGAHIESGNELHVDCANGVGAIALGKLAPLIAQHGLVVHCHNRGGGRLNHLCGSDYVQKHRRLPSEFAPGLPDGTACCSIDGDADRIVFFTPRGGDVVLLDGDRIAALAATFIVDALRDIGPDSSPLSVGVVQTAYANGASTAYLRSLRGVEVVLAKTGVKHLHVCAKRFDFGVYFEANGHGTVIFSENARTSLAQSGGCAGAQRLLACLQVTNQAIGDALSGMLMVESVLRSRRWAFDDWAAMYDDLPSKQAALRVPDRNAIVTADAETRCVAPDGLQAEIDAAVSTFSRGRAFVRPSGTEDVVRIYAEAATGAECNALCDLVMQLVRRYTGGMKQVHVLP